MITNGNSFLLQVLFCLISFLSFQCLASVAFEPPQGWIKKEVSSPSSMVKAQWENSKKTALLQVFVMKNQKRSPIQFLDELDKTHGRKNLFRGQDRLRPFFNKVAGEQAQGKYDSFEDKTQFPVFQEAFVFKQEQQIYLVSLTYRKTEAKEIENLRRKLSKELAVTPSTF